MNTNFHADFQQLIKDDLTKIAIRRLADRRVSHEHFPRQSEWNAVVEEEMRWVACQHQAHQIADLNMRELAEMVRDGLEPLDLDDWMESEAMGICESESSSDAYADLMSDLRELP